MLDHVIDWLELGLRWIHVVTGVAWIGTSFYFNWLNNNVRPQDDPEPGVAGDLWSIHGGAFYRVVKYSNAPEKLPKVLHWFKWEAYFTWISGLSLLCVAYYLHAGLYVIDPSVRIMEPWQAIALGLGVIAAGWTAYHFICKTPLGKNSVALFALGFPVMVGIAWFLTTMFGGRAAYIHVGALIGTIMAGNVFFVIIPNQQKMVALMTSGQVPDPALGQAGSLRSLHNNYFTLPVLFIMISNHYSFTFGDKYNWAILGGISLAGGLIRHWFNLRGKGQNNVYILPIAAMMMLGLTFVTLPKSYADHRPVQFTEVREIIETHCVDCHSATPTRAGFAVAPVGVMFNTRQQIQTMAARINAQVVVSQAMPLGNTTAITQEERDIIGAWFHQGASIDVSVGAVEVEDESEAATENEAGAE